MVGLYGNLVTAGVSHPSTPLTSDSIGAPGVNAKNKVAVTPAVVTAGQRQRKTTRCPLPGRHRIPLPRAHNGMLVY